MKDVLFALIALVGFIVFCGVLIVYVPHPDLVAVIVIVILMICFDFIRELLSHRSDR